MAEVSLAHSYPELFRVTGPLPSLVLRTEDVWQRYKPDSSKRFGALNPGFPYLPRSLLLTLAFSKRYFIWKQFGPEPGQ